MNELELTKKYWDILTRVYKEHGFLAALGHELKSTLYSLESRIEGFFDHCGGVGDAYSLSQGGLPKGLSIKLLDREGARFERGEKRQQIRESALLTYAFWPKNW
ncbi:hypothetical protein HYX16_03925 [Candidatus Woesearchaeota archaeon]|nr:hypothetical protein [Candidatus Woesearchaeota archaeon]